MQQNPQPGCLGLHKWQGFLQRQDSRKHTASEGCSHSSVGCLTDHWGDDIHTEAMLAVLPIHTVHKLLVHNRSRQSIL